MSIFLSPYHPNPFCTAYKSQILLVILSVFAEATPKTLMRVMGVPGLTLYHLKSHLQAFSVYTLCSLF